jgi:hypothetical protein
MTNGGPKVLIAFFLLALGCRTSDKTQGSDLPYFRTQDIRGSFIDSRDFSGKYLFIAFIDPKKKSDLEICRSVWEKEGGSINMILVSQSLDMPEEFVSDSSIGIIHDKDSGLFRLFRIPTMGFYLFFDPHGKLLDAGNNRVGYKEGPQGAFSWHLHGLRFSRSVFIPAENENISSYSWLNQLRQIMATGLRPFYLFGLFSSICDGCSSGKAIDLLKKLRSELVGDFEVHAILSPAFEDKDIIPLITQLRLNFPVSLADENLSLKWNELESIYRPSSINELIIMADSDGDVLLVFDPSIKDAYDSFFHRCISFFRSRNK